MKRTCKASKQVSGKRGPKKSARRIAAESAGLSRHQMYQALAIAAIPEDDFERMISGLEDPPSLEELVRIGRGQQGKRIKKRKTCPHCGEEL